MSRNFASPHVVAQQAGLDRNNAARAISFGRLLILCLMTAACHAGTEAAAVASQPLAPAAASNPSSVAKDVPAADISSAAAVQEFAVERSLGADCPTPGQNNSDYGPDITLLYGMCRGHLPAHIAHLLAQLPPEEQQGLLSTRVGLRAVPGLGGRADFWVSYGEAWIRSFEGPDPGTTVYLMQGRFCPHEDQVKRYCTIDLRAYRTQAGAPPRDVSAEILPAEPVLTAAERAFYYDDYRGPSDPFLLTEKLYYAPTMRWVMEFDSHDTLPKDTPNRLNGNMVHLGFLRWTGARFELRPTVPRSQWPCFPVTKGEAACRNDYANPDPYVTPDP